VEQGIVRKAGAWYTYEGDQLGQGKENARTFLKDNPDTANEIEKRIKEKLGVGPRLDADPAAAADGAANGHGASNGAGAPAGPGGPAAPVAPAAAAAAAKAPVGAGRPSSRVPAVSAGAGAGGGQ
jgi:recombination protein RecA